MTITYRKTRRLPWRYTTVHTRQIPAGAFDLVPAPAPERPAADATTVQYSPLSRWGINGTEPGR